MQVPVVIIGAGHAGLAMSRRLADRSIDHVVIERGEVANSWRHHRWPSLRLLTPNWQTRLPGAEYDGPDPNGYASAEEVADFIAGYARRLDAPVRTGVDVTGVQRSRSGYRISTSQGIWNAHAVVLASGACSLPSVPAVASAIPGAIRQVTPVDYRGPDSLERGAVLVVGASATGVQLAEEIHRSGRPVTLAAGEHVRLPRTYRGRDIFWWLDVTGVLDQRDDEVDDLVRARALPSPQLVGARRSVDIAALRALGVEVVGRLVGMNGGVAQFSGSLANVCRLADLKMGRLLDTFDEWAAGASHDLDPPERVEPTLARHDPKLEIDLRRNGIRTIVWATGFRPDYSWLNVDVLDRHGRLIRDGGVVRNAPGLYALGLPMLLRRRSTYISAASGDTADVATHLHAHLDRITPARRALTTATRR